MKCDLKTTLQIGMVLAVLIVIAAIVFPQLRPAIIGIAPFALLALCPLGMMFGMRGMSSSKKRNDASNR